MTAKYSVDELMTAKDASEASGYTKTHIQRECRQGHFPNAFKMAGAWVIPKGDFDRWMASGRRHIRLRQLPMNGI